MKNLAKFSLQKEQHQARSLAHTEAGKAFKASVEGYDFQKLETANYAPKAYPKFSIAGEDPREKTTLFGAVNTVYASGCVVYVSDTIRTQYDSTGSNTSVLELAEEAANKGYRSWKFANYSKPYFTSPKVDVDEVKEQFKDIVPEVQDCETVEELESLLGKVTGIGGSMFLIDNIICMLSQKELTAVRDTRITTVEKVIENLKNGIMVPIRVNNSIYHNDPNRAGGHYVILAGIEKGEAVILDSAIGINRIPAKRLFEAAVANEGLIAVWDLSKI